MRNATNGELKIMIDNLTTNIDGWIKDSKEYHAAQQKTQSEILSNVIKTNGRVTNLESTVSGHKVLLEDYGERRAEVKGAIKLWAVICGAIILGGSYLWVLYMEHFKAEIIKELSPVISETVISNLEDKYNIQIKY